MKSVAILGSCVSRDNFNTRHNPTYTDRYRVDLLQNQSSIISLMAAPASFDSDWLAHEEDWNAWVLTSDLTKEFLYKIAHLQPDILIIDLFGDARFGVTRFDNTFITHNEWRLPSNKIGERIDHTATITMKRTPVEYEQAFRFASERFASFCRNHLKNTQIIINSARTVNDCLNAENVRYPKFQADWINQNWDALEPILTELLPDSHVISGHSAGAASHDNHIWGSAPFHYEKAVYRRFIKKLDAFIG